MKLKELREKNGMTQTELAIKLGMSLQNLRNYERGSYSKMSEEMEKAISEIFKQAYTYKR